MMTQLVPCFLWGLSDKQLMLVPGYFPTNLQLQFWSFAPESGHYVFIYLKPKRVNSKQKQQSFLKVLRQEPVF